MSNFTVARRYAAALADVVGQPNETNEVQAELLQFEKIMTESPLLGEIFGNPSVPYEQKSKVLETLLGKTKPRPTTANFLRVLLRNQRLAELPFVNQRFAAVLQERAGVVAAEITTAQPLAETEKTALQARLEAVTGKKVLLKYQINDEIIGGIVTRIGSTIYDGSVKSQLENLKTQLIKG